MARKQTNICQEYGTAINQMKYTRFRQSLYNIRLLHKNHILCGWVDIFQNVLSSNACFFLFLFRVALLPCVLTQASCRLVCLQKLQTWLNDCCCCCCCQHVEDQTPSFKLQPNSKGRTNIHCQPEPRKSNTKQSLTVEPSEKMCFVFFLFK